MEDPGEEEKRFCKNCQQDVPAANFVMHEVHCARNITCCPKCKEPVPRATLEEHIEENHKLVNCKQCYEEMESCLLEEHMESKCPMRMIYCEYCELQFKAGEKYEHEDQCGSRTDICEKCQQYVMLKMMKEHKEHLCGKPVSTAPPLQLPPDEWAFEGFLPTERGGAGAHVGGVVEPAELDQSWMDALNACREEGQSVDSLVAQNLAHENHMFKPVKNDPPTSDEELAVRLQENEEQKYYDPSSSTAVEEQKRQFEQLRQMQEDAEMAQRLQEQLDAEEELGHMMPHGDHMMPNNDHVMPNNDHMPSHMIPVRDHMMPHLVSDEDEDNSNDHVIPNNDWVLHDDHMMHDEDHMRSNTDHVTPHMNPPVDYMMPHDNQLQGLSNDFSNFHVNDRPQRDIVPKEGLLPCEWCGKGIPPEYLQTHQLQQCPRLPRNNNVFMPSHATDPPPPMVTDVTDHEDITPTREGTYSVIHCQFCNARIPSNHYPKHLELCDNANETGPCEHCHQSIPLHELFQHEVTCRYNSRLYRPPAMKFPNNPWPGKGKGSHKLPRRLEPVAMTTDMSMSSGNKSFHSNGEVASYHHDVEHSTSSYGMTSHVTKRPVVTHEQLVRRPVHTYSPAGAGSVSVNAAGIQPTSYPPSQQ